MSTLIAEINELLAAGRVEASPAAVIDNLSANSAALMRYLPESIQRQLLAERDPHGNVQVSLIETEKLLADLVQHELERMRRAGRYAGAFSAQCFFLGYEGRAALPRYVAIMMLRVVLSQTQEPLFPSPLLLCAHHYRSLTRNE